MDQIIEPLKEYENFYKDKFKEDTKEYFEELVEKSGVSREENEALVQEYYSLQGNASYMRSKLKNSKIKRTVCVVFAVLGLLIVLLSSLNIAGKPIILPQLTLLINIILICVGAILAITCFTLIFTIIRKEIKTRQAILDDLESNAKEVKDAAYAQIYPLIELFHSDMTRELVSKVTPNIVVDKNYKAVIAKFLSDKYSFGELEHIDYSILELMSGKIVDNPFIVEREKSHEMGSKSYSGSLTVEWEEIQTDSDGNQYTVTRSETLTASVTKPYPEYYEITRTLYFCDACPNLSFSRSPKLSQGDSDKKVDRIVRRGEKKINKRSMDTKNSFMASGNSEFEVLLGALDRDNEIEFRTMFTPTAQRNLVSLIKDKNHYGDDFYFEKSGPINVITTIHGQSWDFDTYPERYFSFDIEEVEDTFNKYNNEYFKNLYFELAPLLSVPLYQESESGLKEQDLVAEQNTSTREATALANMFKDEVFDPVNAATQTILKLRYVGKFGKVDKYEVVARSYQAINRVDYVTKWCSNGKYYDVPVEWIEYSPISKASIMCVVDMNNNDIEYNNLSEKDDFTGFVNRYVNSDNYVYNKGLFAFVTNTFDDNGSKMLEDILK